MELPEGSSLKASGQAASRFAQFLDENSEEIENYTYYVGEGAPRFVLTVDPKLPTDNLSQFVIVAKDANNRDALTAKLRDYLAENIPEVKTNISVIQTGPITTHISSNNKASKIWRP